MRYISWYVSSFDFLLLVLSIFLRLYASFLSSLMDPLSALSIATSVAQFVDFTSKLVTGSYKIYKSASGASPAHSELRILTENLIDLNQRLNKSLTCSSTAGEPRTPHDEGLYNLCNECNGIAADLVAALERLRRQHRTVWSSFRHALLMIWSEDEVNSLQQRVDSFRQQISMHILVTLREQVMMLEQQQMNKDGKISRSLKEFHEETKGYLRDMNQNMMWQTEMIEAIYRSQDQGQTLALVEPSLSIPRYLSDNDKAFFINRILADLDFWELEDRYERVAEAHHKTFRWIFDEPKSHTWSSFVSWLQGSEADPLFYVYGPLY